MSRKIDDHSFWAGKGKEYPLPMDSKMKSESSAEGKGAFPEYPDTNEKIVRDQHSGTGKIGKQPMKPGYRY